MKVELFLGQKDETLEGVVAKLVGLISPHARLEVHRFYEVADHRSVQLARRYARLLEACIPPNIGLKVIDQRVMGWAFYLRVYWSPGEDDAYGPPSRRDLFGSRDFVHFFPALAIRNRMAFVPASQASVMLEGAAGEASFDPYVAGSLRTIDFGDHDAIERELEALAPAVQREVAREARLLRRQFPALAGRSAAMAATLGLEQAELTAALANDSALAEALDELDCSFEPVAMALGRWTRAELRIANARPVELGRVTVSAAGPLRVLPEKLVTRVPAAGAGVLSISLFPLEAGEFPLEIRISPPADSPLADETAVRYVWITCGG
ncbi:MAG: hypothetical protein HY825_18495 [Acidobacteria bacterium]|nr:hypothetical protein [Acidobacteriota bacterium]